MNVTLSAQFESMIQERVAGGDFVDATDVVEEALRRMESEDRAKLEQLRTAIKVGIDQVERGECREYTQEVHAEILANGLKKFRERRRLNLDVRPQSSSDEVRQGGSGS